MALLGGYMRVSSKGDRDPDRWLTVPHQHEAIERWCSDHEHRLVDLRQDIDVSGASRTALTSSNSCPCGVGRPRRNRRGQTGPVQPMASPRRQDHRPIDRAGGLFVAAADGFDLRTDSGRPSVPRDAVVRRLRASTVSHRTGARRGKPSSSSADNTRAVPARVPTQARRPTGTRPEDRRAAPGAVRATGRGRRVSPSSPGGSTDQDRSHARGGRPTARWVGRPHHDGAISAGRTPASSATNMPTSRS